MKGKKEYKIFKRKIPIILFILLIGIFVLPVIEAEASSYNEGVFIYTDVLNIDNPNKFITKANKAGCSSLDDIKEFKIYSEKIPYHGTLYIYPKLNCSDIYWIRDNLKNLEVLEIGGDVILEDNKIPYGAFHFNSSIGGHPNITTFKYTSSQSLTNIGAYAFNKCPKLKYVEIPNTVTSFGIGVFSNSGNLRFVKVANLKETNTWTFENCVSLEKVELPNVTTINNHAFRGCTNLKALFLGINPPTVGYQAFFNCPSQRNVFVPEDAIEAYKAVNDGNTSDNLWYGWNIISKNKMGPKVMTLSPANNGFVGLNNLVITFNENIEAGVGEIKIYSWLESKLLESINVEGKKVTISGKTVTIDPDSNLKSGSIYYVKIPKGAFQNELKQDFLGFFTENDWLFNGDYIVVSDTMPASNISSTSATLKGCFRDSCSPITVTFEYGTDINYGTVITADQSPVMRLIDVRQVINGLIPDTTYHYRIVGENIVGIGYGNDITFKTAPSTKSMTSYSPVTLTQTGDIAHNNVQYQTASEVISALPTEIAVTLEDGSTENVPVNWADTDDYDATTAGNYTFTATWAALPSGVDNNDNVSAPTCEVNVLLDSTYINAETPVITNNLTDKAGQVGDTITLDATATVGDGGKISYQWYETSDKSTLNPLPLSATTAAFTVNTSIAGISYYYCEVTNTNNAVNGNKVAKVDSNVAKVTITTTPPTTKSMASYSPVTLTQTGDIAQNNVQYQTASEVISALPTEIAVTLEDGSTENVPVNWVDTDNYNPSTEGNYTFTATWGTMPSGVDNNDNVSAPTCELKVAKGSTGGGSSSGGSSSNYTPKPKTPTEKANDKIKKAKPNAQGIFQVSVEVNTTRKGKTTFELPNNFLGNKAPVELTIENKDLQVTLLNEMFTEKEKQKQVELIIEQTNKEELGLSEEEKKEIGDNAVYNIYLKVNGKKVDWEGDEDITISIKLDKYNKENHKFVAVYYDRKGNIQILKSSYYQNGKLYFTTKHLSDYGVIYVESTFKDIENHWAKEAIEALTARDIIKGVSKDEFRPEKDISRADLVTLMVRYFGFTANSTNTFTSDSPKVFDDLASNKYYAKSIAIAKEIGLAKGCGSNLFKPLEPVSRQDMMVLLHRALEISGEYPNIKSTDKSYLKFSDSSEISSYALKSVELMINSKVVNERLAGICPKENATRAEVAHALYNIMQTSMK